MSDLWQTHLRFPPLTVSAFSRHCCSLEHNQQPRLRLKDMLAPGAGTLSFLPNFHVIGFINNFLSK